MIKQTFGITQEPFHRDTIDLLPQQLEALNTIKIHSQHGGFSVIIGQPGVGKTVLRQHLDALGDQRDCVVVSFSRTMHTYFTILKQLAESLKLEATRDEMEKEIINAAFLAAHGRKTLYTLIDEAHLMEMSVLRKLRLMFERFPKKHNLVLFGQPELLHHLSMTVNTDIKSRITYSTTLAGLNDQDMKAVILNELDAVRLGHNTFDEGALELILRQAQGNLRLCCNLCYGSLVAACCDDAFDKSRKTVLTRHVNAVLVQPHWRSHEELLLQQAASASQRGPSK
jgi:MSHA biogenesis protein MshM